MSKHLFTSLCALTFAMTAVGQSGRKMRLNALAVIGQTALFSMRHPAAAAGNLYAILWSPPFIGAGPLAVPGFTVNGLLRIDLAHSVTLVSGVLQSGGETPNLVLTIPNDPLLVGYAWELQGVDLSPANVLTLSDDDLAVVVSAPPLPAANMVAIAPGTFLMGSPVTPLGVTPYFNQPHSQPVHQVTIGMPFWIGKYEVTQAEYLAVMGSNPSQHLGVATRPVEMVSWNNALAYCSALTALETAAGRVPLRYQYRLPTEAEWEYCCRAGATTEFQFGPTLVCGQGNFAFSYHANNSCYFGNTVIVGSYAPNAWGLFDMHGNVWEWCLDAWETLPNYPSTAVVDPYVPASIAGALRCIRGGSWYFDSYSSRSAYRGRVTPGAQTVDLGFRVVLAPVIVP